MVATKGRHSIDDGVNETISLYLERHGWSPDCSYVIDGDRVTVWGMKDGRPSEFSFFVRQDSEQPKKPLDAQ